MPLAKCSGGREPGSDPGQRARLRGGKNRMHPSIMRKRLARRQESTKNGLRQLNTKINSEAQYITAHKLHMSSQNGEGKRTGVRMKKVFIERVPAVPPSQEVGASTRGGWKHVPEGDELLPEPLPQSEGEEVEEAGRGRARQAALVHDRRRTTAEIPVPTEASDLLCQALLFFSLDFWSWGQGDSGRGAGGVAEPGAPGTRSNSITSDLGQ